MTGMDAFVEWCEEEITRMQESIERMKTGDLKIESLVLGKPRIDETEKLIKNFQADISEMQGIVERNKKNSN